MKNRGLSSWIYYYCEVGVEFKDYVQAQMTFFILGRELR